MQAIYDEAKKVKAFYTPENLQSEISSTKEAQRRVLSEIQLTQQKTEEALATLKANGKTAVF